MKWRGGRGTRGRSEERRKSLPWPPFASVFSGDFCCPLYLWVTKFSSRVRDELAH